MSLAMNAAPFDNDSSEYNNNENDNVFPNYDEDDDEDDDSLHGNKKNVNFEQYSPNTKGKIK